MIRGGAGADTIDGGEGRDWAGYWFSDAGVTVDLATGEGRGGDAAGDRLSNIENLEGSHHDDVLLGNAHANRIDGHDGHDRLAGGDGNDTLRAGNGNDIAAGGNGRDTITGGEGHDDLRGESGNDRLDGGDGVDFLSGGDGEDFILGGDGNDTIDAGAGQDIVHGGKGNDVIYGGPDPDVIVYDYGWTQIKARYDASDYSIWIEAPDGKDHVFSALTFATTTGTYRFDVPSQSWVLDSTKTSADWLANP